MCFARVVLVEKSAKTETMSISRRLRRAKLEAMSFQYGVSKIAKEHGIDPFGLTKHEAVDLILKAEETLRLNAEKEEKLSEAARRLKQSEDDYLQHKKKLESSSRKTSGMSNEVRLRLDYHIKVALLTGVLDLSNPSTSAKSAGDCFRFNFETVPAAVTKVFGEEDTPAKKKKKSPQGIRGLWLTNNRICSLPESLMSLQRNLVELGLEGNLLEDVDPCISKLLNLEHLHLSRNRIEKVPSHLSQLTNLRELNIAGNRLTEFPLSICHMRELRRLDVSHNMIVVVRKEIRSLSKLVELNLNHNRIQKLPEQLGNLRGSLKFLHLEGNSTLQVDEPKTKSVIEALRTSLLVFDVDGLGEKEETKTLREDNSEWTLDTEAAELRAMLRNRAMRRTKSGAKKKKKAF